MTTQRKFWKDTGRTSNDGETSGTLLHTPKSADSVGSATRTNVGQQRDLRQDILGICNVISSVAVSPASLFRWLGVEPGTVMSVGCGPLFAKWYESSDRDGYFLKMSGAYCQPNLDGSLPAYSETWPASGSMQNGKCYRQQRLVLRISAKESSLLPTPVSNDDNKSVKGHLAMKARMKGGPRKTITSLNVMAKGGLLPTPRAIDGRPKGNGPRPDTLTGKMLYTDGKRTGELLNPQFVEAIMGLPIGWTDLEDSGTR